jgi:hypothetical protein
MSYSKNTALKAVPPVDPARKVSYEILVLTPEMASEWLLKNKGNRNLRSGVVASYQRDISDGEWLMTGDPIRFDWNDRLIDGQHRLEAIIASGVPVEVLVIRGLDPRVQDVIDSGSKRSAPDVLKFNGLDHNNATVAGAARIAIAREAGQLRYATSAHTPVKATSSQIRNWWQANRDIEEAAQFASKHAKSIGAAPSALAYTVFMLNQIDVVAATEFFTSISEFRTTGANDPRATLLKTFNKLRDDRTHMSAGVQLFTIFTAWNAHRDGKSMSKFVTTKRDRTGVMRPAEIPVPR